MVLGKVWQACGILMAIGFTVAAMVATGSQQVLYWVGAAVGVLFVAAGRIVCSLGGSGE